MSAKRSRALPWLAAAFVLIVLLAAAPVISVFAAAGISNVLGCALNEGGGSRCLLLGVDIGNTLSEMFVFGWLAIDTVPLGVVALVIWLVVACVVAIVSWRRRRRPV